MKKAQRKQYRKKVVLDYDLVQCGPRVLGIIFNCIDGKELESIGPCADEQFLEQCVNNRIAEMESKNGYARIDSAWTH